MHAVSSACHSSLLERLLMLLIPTRRPVKSNNAYQISFLCREVVYHIWLSGVVDGAADAVI